MTVLETPRLVLRRLNRDDAPFILKLMTEPSWLQFIGDRGVRTIADARDYILTGPVAMYRRNGFGLYLVTLKSSDEPIGMCGLIKRARLTDVDIGFAFLPQYWSQGFAFEAAAATLEYARDALSLRRVVAITLSSNHSAAKLLERLGLKFERMIKLSADSEELRLFSTT